MASIAAGFNGSFGSLTVLPASGVVSALAAAAADMEGSSEPHDHMNLSVDVDDVDGVEIESQQQTRAPFDAFTSSDTGSHTFHVLDSDDSGEDEGEAVAAPNVAVDTTTLHDHDTHARDTPGVHTQGSPFACHREDRDENTSRFSVPKKRKRTSTKHFACKWDRRAVGILLSSKATSKSTNERTRARSRLLVSGRAVGIVPPAKPPSNSTNERAVGIVLAVKATSIGTN
jgi:hypothetical protein